MAENMSITQAVGTGAPSERMASGEDVESTHSSPATEETMNTNLETPHTQQTEGTMNANPDSALTRQEEEAGENGFQSTQDSKTQRKRTKDVPKKICQMRALAQRGCFREEICEQLGISLTVFETLLNKLIRMDKRYYDIPHVTADRNGRVGKGGIMISADRLLAMGVADLFAEGTAITVTFDGEKILIERAGRRIARPKSGAEALSHEGIEAEFPDSLNPEASEAEVA